MQLSHARIQNFRSLKEVNVHFDIHTAIIGGNGAGKSSILKALERFYSTAKTLDADDYFGRDQTLTIEIELTFSNLSESEEKTFATRVRNGVLTITRIFDSSSSSGRYYGSVLQNADFQQVRLVLSATAKRDAYKVLRSSSTEYAILPAVSNATAIEPALLGWEAANPEKMTLQMDDGQFFGFQNASRGALQRHTTFVFVPAVRDAANEAADGKTSAIGRLLELIVRSAILQRKDIQSFKADMTTRYKALVSAENLPELQFLANRLTADLKGLYHDASVGLTWREVDEFPVPLPIADVSLSDDGFGGPVDRQGHGLQRAFIFTLLQQLARTSAASAETPASSVEDEEALAQAPSVILAIEEPELYQHPTKQRHFAAVLRKLSGGMLPGVDGPTQVMFASHSPMFVSLDCAAEIRLVRRSVLEGSDFKQCNLRSLDLSRIAKKLEVGWNKPEGTFNAATLKPRLHILGNELAEGFFASGVVLVEGRSDRAALYAMARIMGCNFEAAGIAILSAEGKENLDRPLTIFQELGIPTFVIWDCDHGQRDTKTHTNHALARLCFPELPNVETPTGTVIGSCFAHFHSTLELTLMSELTHDLHAECLKDACIPFGLTPSNETHKIPEVMFQILHLAKLKGAVSETLSTLVNAIWLHIKGEPLDSNVSV